MISRDEVAPEHLVEVCLGLLRELLLVSDERIPVLRLAAPESEATGGFLERLLEHLGIQAPERAEDRSPHAGDKRELVRAQVLAGIADRADRIEKAVGGMTQILEDVLLIGRAESGILTCNPTPLDLGRFCGEMVQSLQRVMPLTLLFAALQYPLLTRHEARPEASAPDRTSAALAMISRATAGRSLRPASWMISVGSRGGGDGLIGAVASAMRGGNGVLGAGTCLAYQADTSDGSVGLNAIGIDRSIGDRIVRLIPL